MQFANLNLNRSLVWSVICLGLVALVLIVAAPPLLDAAFASSPDELQVASALQTRLTGHEEALNQHQARFNGRSVFYKPLPKPKPVPQRDRPVVLDTTPAEPPKPPGPPPPNPIYTGPSIMAILGDEVWFTNPSRGEPPLRIKVGEEAADIKVNSVDPPWRINVNYRDGGPYDVSLFDLKSFLTDATESTQVAPPPGLIEAPRTPPVTPPDAAGSTPPDGSDNPEGAAAGAAGAASGGESTDGGAAADPAGAGGASAPGGSAAETAAPGVSSPQAVPAGGGGR